MHNKNTSQKHLTLLIILIFSKFPPPCSPWQYSLPIYAFFSFFFFFFMGSSFSHVWYSFSHFWHSHGLFLIPHTPICWAYTLPLLELSRLKADDSQIFTKSQVLISLLSSRSELFNMIVLKPHVLWSTGNIASSNWDGCNDQIHHISKTWAGESEREKYLSDFYIHRMLKWQYF